MSGGDDFWSRRKAKVREEAEAERERAEQQARAAEMAELEEKSDEEILAELELPDPDKLESGDDFAAFLKAAVPERLRRRALRRLWLTNPTLANVDGLVDYGEDFTDAANVVAGLQTVYRVGKGMLKDVLEADEPERDDGVAVATAGEACDESMAGPDEGLAAAALTEPTDWAQTVASEEPVAAPKSTGEDIEIPEQEAAMPPRRRMRFSFPV